MEVRDFVSELDPLAPLVPRWTFSLQGAGRSGSRIRHACMGIGLLAEVPELVRTHRCKRNYAAEPGRYRLDVHSSSDN
jgi:hypothetical protein